MAIETIGYSAAGGWSIPRLFAGAEYTASLAGVGAWPAGASGARLVVIAKVRGGVRVAESAEMTPDAPTARISFLTAEFRDIFRALYPTDSVTVRLEVITAEGDLVAAANQACGVSHLLWREKADSVPSYPSGVSIVAAVLAAHKGRTDNPHRVTAEQVGAVTKTDLKEYARLKHDNGFTGKNSFGGGALVINTDGYVDAATRMQLSVVNGTGPTLVLSDHGVFFKSSTDSKAITPSAFYLGWQGRDFVAARDFCVTNDAIDLTNPRYASEEFDAATGVFPCYNSFSWGDHPYRFYYVYLDESSTVPGVDLETSNLWPIMRDNQAVDISVYVNNQSTLDVVAKLYDESYQTLTGHNVLYGTTYLLEFTVIKCSYAPRLLIRVRN